MAYDQSIMNQIPMFQGGAFYKRRDDALRNQIEMAKQKAIDDENARQEAVLPGQLAEESRKATEFQQTQDARKSLQEAYALPPQIQAMRKAQSPSIDTGVKLPPVQNLPPWVSARMNPQLNPPAASQALPPNIPQPQQVDPVEEQLRQRERVLQARTLMPNADPDKLNTEKVAIRDMRDWIGLKPKLDQLMTPGPKGWNPLSGEKATAFSKALAAIPAYLMSNPHVKEWLSTAKGEQQNTVFNPFNQQRIEQTDIGQLRAQSAKAAKGYTDTRQVMSTVEPEYLSYKKDPTGPGAKFMQQSLLDKFVQMSLNKSPTEAQYEIAQSFPGLKTVIDKETGHLMWGQIVTEQAVDAIVDLMRKAGIERGSQLKDLNDVITQQAEAGGVDPSRIGMIPNNVVTSDSTKWAQPMPPKPGAPAAYADQSKEARYQAWKKANGK